MSEEQIIDLDKLISDKTVKGVADVRLELENKKLGDGEILRLAEMEVLGYSNMKKWMRKIINLE